MNQKSHNRSVIKTNKLENFDLNCIFCNPEKNSLPILTSTKNFYVIPDGAPLNKGHLLIVTKGHYSCFGDLDRSLWMEYQEIYSTISSFLEKTFGRLVVFEHGILGQTIFHAHLHFLPTRVKIMQKLDKTTSVLKISNFHYVKNILKNKGGYLFISEDGNDYSINPATEIPAGYLHSYLLPGILKVPRSYKKRAEKAAASKNIIFSLWQQTTLNIN